MDQLNFDKLKALLDEKYEWPAQYKFKFIVPHKSSDSLLEVLDTENLEKRPSKSGKYVSYTSLQTVKSSNHVIEIYKSVAHVEGLISL